MGNRYFGLLKANPSFRLFASAQLVSRLGDNITSLAVIWYLVHAIEDPFYYALVLLLSKLPETLLSPFLGFLGDQHSKKKMLILMDLSSFATFIVLGVAIMNRAPLYTVVAILLLESSIQSLWIPLYYSSIPHLVARENLGEANVVMSFIYQTTWVVGAFVSGFLIKYVGIPEIIFFNAITFLISAALLFRCDNTLFIVEAARQGGRFLGQTIENLKEGLSYVLRNKPIFYLMSVYSISNFFFEPLMVLWPILLTRYIADSSVLLGVMDGMMAAGMFAGTVVIGYLKHIRNRFRIILICEIFLGVIVLLMAIYVNPTVAISAFFMVGVVLSVSQVNVDTCYHELCDKPYLTRVMSIRVFVSQACRPAGKFIGGYCASVLGVARALLLTGGMMALFGLGWMKKLSNSRHL